MIENEVLEERWQWYGFFFSLELSHVSSEQIPEIRIVLFMATAMSEGSFYPNHT